MTEIKWAVSSTKKSERPLLASKIIRKALQSNHSTLVQLMYKPDPDDYKTEGSVSKLIKYLEESPLNRQPLPDAGNKIGGYYRRLQRTLKLQYSLFKVYSLNIPISLICRP